MSIRTIQQTFVKLAYLEVAFLKIGIFVILVCNLQTQPGMSTFFYDFVAPYGYQHLVKFQGHTSCSS